jgi:class 3 adenylate cyclase
VIDVQHARYLAHHIPGAKLIELPGEVHTPWLGNRDELLNAVEQFLTGKTRTHEPDRLLATVMFTDIVGSTERAAVLGDEHSRSAKPAVALAGVHSALMPAARITLPHFSV